MIQKQPTAIQTQRRTGMRGVVGEHPTSTNDDSPRAHVLGFAGSHIRSKPFPKASTPETGAIASLYGGVQD